MSRVELTRFPIVKSAVINRWPQLAVFIVMLAGYVFAMVLKPGESTTVESGVFMMHEGMDGPHNFAVHLKTNDPANPDMIVNVLSNWLP